MALSMKTTQASGVSTRKASLANVRPSSARAVMRATSSSSQSMGFLGAKNSLKQQALLGVAPRARSSLNVQARASKAGAGQQVQVDLDKPLGLSLVESEAAGGGLVVKSASGNAAKAGIKAGDTIIYTSSFFGDELWPSDKLSFTNSALKAAPSPVTVVYVRGENTSINVKRLPKKPAPPRFGRKLTKGQEALATHICVDCGYVYCDATPFDDVKDSYRCPQCNAPKRRFVPYDIRSGQAKGMAEGTIGTVATLIGGLLGIAVLAYLALNS